MDMLFLPPDAPPRLHGELRVHWLPAEGPARTCALAECPVQGRPLALVLPVEQCSFFAVALPTRKARWMDRALAYAVEDLLADNVDDLHLVRGETLPDGRCRVAAIRRVLLAGWRADLRRLGLRVAAIHVDADLLPREGTQVLFGATRALLGGAVEARLAFAPQDWPLLAERCPPPRHAQGIAEQAPGAVDSYRRTDDPLRSLAGGRAAALDLCRGGPASGEAGAAWRRWRSGLALLGGLLAVQWLLTLGQAWHLQRLGDRQAAANEALYRALFPDEPRIVNLRAQFDQHLRRATAAEQSLEAALARFAGHGVDPAAVRLRQLQYDRQGRLALLLESPDREALQRLAAAGRLAVEPDDGGPGPARARLVIGE